MLRGHQNAARGRGGWNNRGLNPDVADFLVRYVFIILANTIEASHSLDLPAPIGIRVHGRNGGEWHITVSDGALVYEQASLDDCGAILDFDSASFVLTFFGRIRAGTAHGDRELADRFRGIFFTF